jgi:hypothetical protein
MAIDPVMAASMIASLFGGGGDPSIPGPVRRDSRWLRLEGRDMVRESKTPVGSLPQEQAMLATMNALLGQQFGQQKEAMAGLANPLGPGAGFTPDMMQNMLQSFMAQQQAGQSGMLQQFMQGRQGMRQQGLNNIAQAGQLFMSGMQPGQPSSTGNMAGFLSQYAQSQAFLNAMKAQSAKPMTPGFDNDPGTAWRGSGQETNIFPR